METFKAKMTTYCPTGFKRWAAISGDVREKGGEKKEILFVKKECF